MWKPMILDVECIVCNKTLHKINHDPRSATQKMGKITNNNRRLRTPNWSLEEKQFLLELIMERKAVVVTKNNNGPNYSEEKDVAWNEILRELASKFGNKFSVSSIKKVKTQWQNMKRIAREEISLNGPQLQKFSRQSLEVCTILDLVKDGVLKRENENLNETLITNVEIKAESVDEDMEQPSCSGLHNTAKLNDSENIPINNASTNKATVIDNNANKENQINKTSNSSMQFDSSASSVSEMEQISELNSFEILDDNTDNVCTMKNASAMTDDASMESSNNINPFQKEMHEFLKFTSAEKQLKMESLKEERQVIRAMRETAELNKIIAEQKLKHILWIKKQEMM